jgi:SSS family solute:Na+ symporter
MFFSGAVLLILLFVLLGSIGATRGIKSGEYTVSGRSAGVSSVSGIIMGALVGGASTVGTVQMAYQWGLSAWWFTLGAGIGCLLLGVWFARPLRNSELVTIPEFLRKSYGPGAGIICLVTSSIGTFISVVAQFLAGIALFMSIFPVNSAGAVTIVSLLVLTFIYLGGLRSYSRIGKAKIFLLYLILLLSTIVIVSRGYSPAGIVREVPSSPFLNILGRGVSTDINALVSMITGVFCTQIYIQGVFAASTAETARKGVFMAALLMPPLGLMGVYIGLYLKATGVAVAPAQALPYFLHSAFHPFLAGIMWCGILITVIGTAAGLSLGIATNIIRDIYMKVISSGQAETDEKKLLQTSRISVALVVISAAVIGSLADRSMILQWSYLSMGLRGVGTFFPLVLSVIYPGRLGLKWALFSMLGGIGGLILWPVFGTSIPPLLAGLLISGILAFCGIFRH